MRLAAVLIFYYEGKDLDAKLLPIANEGSI